MISFSTLTKVKINKGFHNSLPVLFRFGTPDWEYDIQIISHSPIKGEDEKDWNKLIGIKKDFFDPHKKSLMVGWRDTENGRELNFYKHDGNTIHGEPFTIISKNDTINVKFTQDGNLTYICVTVMGKAFAERIDIKRGFLINQWFGGTSSAPIDYYTYFRKRK